MVQLVEAASTTNMDTKTSSGPINFVFLSCHFPPRFRFFAQQLKAKGVNVFGIGDESYDNLHHELKESLQEYYKVQNMEDYDQLYRAVGHFIAKYGRINFIESFNEHWVETDARLREDFNVQDGYRIKEMAQYKRKSGMKKVFVGAGLKCAPGLLPANLEEALAFGRKVGYPLIMKPDSGVGAEGARKINDEAELTKNWENNGNQFIEQFIAGNIETYDGVADKDGNVIFYASLRYSAGIMDLLSGACESIFYYVCKDVPADLKAMGDLSVKAFNVKNRFFHLEYFRTADGGLLPLEINLRPPGGITIDIWNYVHRMDIYNIYATTILGQTPPPYEKAKVYGTYTARRDVWKYVNSHEEVVQKLGKRLELAYAMPSIFSPVMGNFAYIFTSETFEDMIEMVKFIELRA
jgi:hypothetical protein